MHFIRTTSPHPAAGYLAATLNKLLSQKERIVWLISGGVEIAVAVAAQKQLTITEGLVVLQVDERFGPPGHRDSNWQHLLDAGFSTRNIECHPILTGSTISETVQDYTELLMLALNRADYRIGLFGIGNDGHTAGILPRSPAAEDPHLVSAYQAPDFERITITPAAITHLDEAILYAPGQEKRHALQQLHLQLPITLQPMQALKLVRKLVIYSDSGEER